MAEPLWKPSADRIAAANMSRFLERIRAKYDTVASYEDLYHWSIRDPQQFWREIWSFCDIRAGRESAAVLANADRMPGAKWFPEATLNFAENLLRFRDDHPAIVSCQENGHRQQLTYAQLVCEVARMSRAMKSHGVRPGDRIAGFLPNIPLAIIAMLGAASLGAIWSSTSPDFGLEGAWDRFGQIEPKLLFAADGYQYNGKQFDCIPRIAGLADRIASIQRVIVFPYLDSDLDLSRIGQAVRLEDFVNPVGDTSAHEVEQEHALTFSQLPFDHPLYILYSSGTTGRPKCIVHGAGGTLLQHLKELVLHTDMKRDDRIFYFTTCGWMMWNWLVSSLAVGATVVLYDGSPFFPNPNRLFDLIDAQRISIFGTSPKFITAVDKEGLVPSKSHDLSSLRTLLSTGSPLVGEHYDYVYQKVKTDLHLASISGGTDIVSCFALGNPIAPVYRGELQTRGLGMNVQVYDDNGQPTRGRGELVCTAPAPSMPIAFWNDPDGSKYREAYFEKFPGVWHHGDYVMMTEHDGMLFLGRSDAVLNPGGVRIGTAEIYREVEQLDEVLESLVVGQQWSADVRIVLFVKLRDELQLDEPLKQRMAQQIRENTTPRHVPAKIIQVADIPRTISGKIVELAVRDIIHGREIKNRDALANPESLEFFRSLPELKH